MEQEKKREADEHENAISDAHPKSVEQQKGFEEGSQKLRFAQK